MLDTNILVYAADPEAGPRHRSAQDLIVRAASARCVLTLQSLGEFFNVMTRKVRVPTNKARRMVDDWRRVFETIAADTAAYEQAFIACEQHSLPFWDALLWATAQGAGCTTLLTEDFQDGRSLGGVAFLNPFEPKNANRLDRVLPKV